MPKATLQILIFSFVSILILPLTSFSDDSTNTIREKAQAHVSMGNYNDAFLLFEKLLLSGPLNDKKSSNDLHQSIDCLSHLERQREADSLIEKSVTRHSKNWPLLQEASSSYLRLPYYGYTIGGVFERGNLRGGNGDYTLSRERDQARAIQLLLRAIEVAQNNNQTSKEELAELYVKLSDALINQRAVWKLQILTDQEALPDYKKEYYYGQEAAGFAPSDKDGSPILYSLPSALVNSKNDGERWRFALEKAATLNPSRKDELLVKRARILNAWFGVQTLRQERFFVLDDQSVANQKETQDQSYRLHLLNEEETIARLANGIKHFTLPDQLNPIKLYQSVNSDTYKTIALRELALVFLDRRQYKKSARLLRESLSINNNSNEQKLLDQIVGAWGMFEHSSPQTAGQESTLDFRFRNGNSLHLEAYQIKIDLLLKDVTQYLSSSPRNLDWTKIGIANIGARIVEQNETQYIGEKVASWNETLNPRDDHFDRRTTLKMPFKNPGAYLIKATISGGNTSQIIIWLNDAIIINKPLSNEHYYYVADALTGKPLENAEVRFFGYRVEHVNNSLISKFFSKTHIKDLTLKTDSQGSIILSNDKLDNQYQWLVVAESKQGNLAFLGFNSVWFRQHEDIKYDQIKSYFITDRPVYRPGQTVKYKVWIRETKYDQQDKSPFANSPITLTLSNPKGEKIFGRSFQSDAFSGIDGEYLIPEDATLGMYQLVASPPSTDGSFFNGTGSFRVEEYKKPEFEVMIDSPKDPIKLGEKFNAKIKARYYFGSPVTQATVKYKILRSEHSANWYPAAKWDWFFGAGYWWFAYDYSWFPGFSEWGCFRPWPLWWQRANNPPELIEEREVPIGVNGEINITIDSTSAKIMHADHDHSYDISAEVTDHSRRTITGKGNVLVAKKPFSVYAWVDRGYFQAGDSAEAHFAALRLDNKPVQGKGTLKLNRITYNSDLLPKEEVIQSLNLDTDSDGKASYRFKISQPGQYRFSYLVTDNAANTIEGGYLFNVIGDLSVNNKQGLRYNDLEIIPDKKEYLVGEKVKLLINSNKPDSTVLLFIRPSNGIYSKPVYLNMSGQSTQYEIPITINDTPNFFIEGSLIHDGKVFSETRELFIPPDSKVLNVEIIPSKNRYLPGEEAQVKVKVTDSEYKPFHGSLVISTFDKSLEYISSGSNLKDIKEFFWKWRRTHYPQGISSVQQYSYNLAPSGAVQMTSLGVFGDTLANQDSKNELFSRRPQSSILATRSKVGLADSAGASLMQFNEVAPAMANSADQALESSQESKQPVEIEPNIRKEFADTAFWSSTATTDTNGEATFNFKMPENLTAWKIKTWSLGKGTRVGEASSEVITSKNIIIRLQAPRFFVEKDEVILSANIHNYLSERKTITPIIELDGDTLELISNSSEKIEVEAGSEKRVDWLVRVKHEGQATIRMKAISDIESDAVQMNFPVYVHGAAKTESTSSNIREDERSTSIKFKLPSERQLESTRLEIRYSPSLAAALVDALPYLASYPYGCTEQTLSRFLPTVITQKILSNMKIDLDAMKAKHTNLNSQEISDDSERAKQWKRYNENPIYDNREVSKMVKSGLERLNSMQLSDGGWGWFSGFGEYSSAHTTAYVVHGLQLAKSYGLSVDSNSLERGLLWLKNYQATELQKLRNWPNKTEPYKMLADDLDALVFMVLTDSDQANTEIGDLLYRDRNSLSIYAKAMMGLVYNKLNDREKVSMLLKNIEQFIVEDEENQTAYLNLGNNNYWWYWYGSENEAHAYYLKLLARTSPKDKRASRLVKYLLNNRKNATYWSSTRDTAIVIEAMAEYISASGEDAPNLDLDIFLDGKSIKKLKINSENLFTFDNKIILEDHQLTTGEHQIEFIKSGSGPLYINSYLTYFSLEDYIKKAGLEVKIERTYYKLVKKEATTNVADSDGQAINQKIEKYEREALQDLSTLKSGELVEIELNIESKNDYEYLVLEDMKPAGFEPLDIRSGYLQNGMRAYVEFRDEKVAFFLRTLSRGKNSLSYRMRAEIPGKFSVLPTQAYAMYAPEIRANSDEIKLRVNE